MPEKRRLRQTAVAMAFTAAVAVQPVVAQNDEEIPDICDNQLVVAMDNLITLLAAIGPVVGALVAMTAMLVLTYTQNPQKKKKWLKTRNDAIKYGVGILFIGAIMNLLVEVTSPEMASCVDILI